MASNGASPGRDPELASAAYEPVLDGVVASGLDGGLDRTAGPLPVVGMEQLAHLRPGDGFVRRNAEDLREARRERHQVAVRVPTPVTQPSGRHGQVEPRGGGIGAGSRGGKRGFGFLALRDVDAEPVQPQRRAVFAVHRAPAPVHPPHLATGVAEAELDDVVAVVPDCRGHGGLDPRPVVRVHECQEAGLRARESAGGQAEDLFEFATPPHDAGREVARPGAHAPAAHRQREHIAALAQRVRGSTAFRDVREQHGHAFRGGVQPVFETPHGRCEPDVAHGGLTAGQHRRQPRPQRRCGRGGQDVFEPAAETAVPRQAGETLGGVVDVDVPQVPVEGDEALRDGRDDAVEHGAAGLS